MQNKRVDNVVWPQKVSHSPNIFCFSCVYNCASWVSVGYNWPSRKPLIANLTVLCPMMLIVIDNSSNNSVRW